DDADEALGEHAEREDQGEAEHGEEWGAGDRANPPARFHPCEQARQGPRRTYRWGTRRFGRRAFLARFHARYPTLSSCGSRGWGTRSWGDGGGCAGAVEGDEEEVDGEGHPEGDEDVRDVEAGVEVGAEG